MSCFKNGLWYKFSSFMGVTDYKTFFLWVSALGGGTQPKNPKEDHYLTICDFFWKDLEATCWSKCIILIYIKQFMGEGDIT